MRDGRLFIFCTVGGRRNVQKVFLNRCLDEQWLEALLGLLTSFTDDSGNSNRAISQ